MNEYSNETNAQQVQPEDLKLKCPRCGSENVQITRERTGTDKKGRGGAAGTSIAGIGVGKGKTKSHTEFNYRTTCICQNCGYTFDSADLYKEKKQIDIDPNKAKKALKICGKVLLWICFFPIMLSIWLWKTDKIKNKAVKIILIIVLWALLIVPVLTSSGGESDSLTTTSASSTALTSQTTVAITEETTVAFNKNAYKVDVEVGGPEGNTVITVKSTSKSDLPEMKRAVADALVAYKGQEYADKHNKEIMDYIDKNFGKEDGKDFDGKTSSVILSAPNEYENEYRIYLYVY